MGRLSNQSDLVSQSHGTRGYSSVGRAPALQAGCQEFESPYLHSLFANSEHSSIAQSVERLTVNQNVPGSSPGGGVPCEGSVSWECTIPLDLHLTLEKV